jgi:hypothetical protein
MQGWMTENDNSEGGGDLLQCSVIEPAWYDWGKESTNMWGALSNRVTSERETRVLLWLSAGGGGVFVFVEDIFMILARWVEKVTGTIDNVCKVPW